MRGWILVFSALVLAGAEVVSAAPAVDLATAERMERRRAVKEGRVKLPLPGTPDTARPLDRLAAAGLRLGAPMFIRIFKAESALELWVEKKARYVLFATYPVCYWSGTLGPKVREGDRQTPEGFYMLTERLLHSGSRWRRSLNIGYPNVYDRSHGRTGSAILIHGGCDSIGCFAMTDAVNAEIYDLVAASLRAGADAVPVHVFPFRMTADNLARYPAARWTEFWADLKVGYDSFERTLSPPRVTVCNRRYHVDDASPFVRRPDSIELCPADRDRVPPDTDERQMTAQAGAAPARPAKPPPPPCNVGLPSCRRWVSLRDRRESTRLLSVRSPGGRGSKIR